MVHPLAIRKSLLTFPEGFRNDGQCSSPEKMREEVKTNGDYSFKQHTLFCDSQTIETKDEDWLFWGLQYFLVGS